MSALCCVGRHVWVGLSCGTLRVIHTEGGGPSLLAQWCAHDMGVAIVSIVQLGARMYSLGTDGSLKGWSAHVPHALDADCRCADAWILVQGSRGFEYGMCRLGWAYAALLWLGFGS